MSRSVNDFNNMIVSTSSIPSNITLDDMVKTMNSMPMIPIDTRASQGDLNEVIEASNHFDIRMTELEIKIDTFNLRLATLEGRLNRQEADNILKMLQSEDSASVYLAREIMNKFEEDHEYSI